jgi:class 3 adenylate cyclase
MNDSVQFAQMADGREIAYQEMSDNPGPFILHTSSPPYPLDLLDEDPMYDRFLRTLGGCGRLVVFDKPGIGSSDPLDPGRSFHDQMAEAYFGVLDALTADEAWIVGSTLSAIAYTIEAQPHRVLGAVLVNPITPAQFQQNIDSAIERKRDLRMLDINPSRADDPTFLEWSRRARRLGASGHDLAALMHANQAAHERFMAEAKPIADAPRVMIIRRRDAMTDDYLKRWTFLFPDAEVVNVEGADACELALDAGLIAELAVGFITGEPVATPPQRELVAVLFTDLVDSTPNVAASGDSVWRATLDRYEANLQRTIQRHHGKVIKHTGDGALATFPSGTEAVAAAIDLHRSTRDIGLEGRTGIHVGEIEHRDDDIGGIAVHLAARVMGHAEPGEIVVTSTVVESSAGGPHRFSERGSPPLKGIDRPWQVFAVDLDRR